MVQGPFPPQHQGLGGTPSYEPDVWVNIVFLPLFAVFGALHFLLFQINLRKCNIKFPFNAAIMGFCLTRVVATSLRIPWAYQEQNIHLAMTAQIFVYAGVIILIISNLWWSVRIVRAQHPQFGWSKPISALISGPIVLSAIMVAALITSVCVMFYLPDPLSQTAALRIQQTGATLFASFSVLPIPLLLLSSFAKALPSQRDEPIDNFGDKRTWTGPNTIRKKLAICLVSAALLSTGACFRAATNFLGPIPIEAPTPWYLSKLCFYIFNFTIEITLVVFWLLIRVDRIFWVPDASHKPFSYGIQSPHINDTFHDEPHPKPTRPPAAPLNHTPRPPVPSPSRPPTVPLPSRNRDSWGHEIRDFMSTPHPALTTHHQSSFPTIHPLPPSRTSWSRTSTAVASTIRLIPPSPRTSWEKPFPAPYRPGRDSTPRNSWTPYEDPEATSSPQRVGRKKQQQMGMGFDPEEGRWVVMCAREEEREGGSESESGSESLSRYSTAREGRSRAGSDVGDEGG